MATRDNDERIRTRINEGVIEALFVHAQITRLHMTLFTGEIKGEKNLIKQTLWEHYGALVSTFYCRM